MRHYYKVSPNYEKQLKLRSFLHSCQKAEEAAEKYAVRFGAVAYHTHPIAMAGGIAYLEFEKEPDLRTWRKVAVLDGHDCYEPNVMQVEGVVSAKTKFRPSDTSRKVFSKNPRTWNQVRPLKTLQEWAGFVGYRMTDDMEHDARCVHELLKDTLFWHFVEFAALGFEKKKGSGDKVRVPLYAKRAVTAAAQAQKLPVVSADALYSLLGAKTDADADTDAEPSTPQFFEWENQDAWYVALDYEIESADTLEINPQLFTYAMNTAIREQGERESCLD